MGAKKPWMFYYEYHIADHCNLRCDLCGHMSNVAPAAFGDLEQYLKDMKRLQELYRGVRFIRLMGGEPLLNPALPRFIEATREAFETSDLRVVSNGLLIPRCEEALWEAMKSAKASFDVTTYQPTQRIQQEIEEACQLHGVQVRFSPLVTHFSNLLDAREGSLRDAANCPCRFNYLLYNGHISRCPQPIIAKKYQEIARIPYYEEDIIDIYDPSLDGESLNKRLQAPMKKCFSCYDSGPVEWRAKGYVR